MKLFCPEPSCRAENLPTADICTRCGLPLKAYAQTLDYAARLFNRGLDLVQQHQLEQARECFAALVYWYPHDREARNALAMTCLMLNDLISATEHWQKVHEQAPSDSIANQGLALTTSWQKGPHLMNVLPESMPVQSGKGTRVVIVKKKRKKK